MRSLRNCPLNWGKTIILEAGIQPFGNNVRLPVLSGQILHPSFRLNTPLGVRLSIHSYELTPEGLRREAEVGRSASITKQTGVGNIQAL
jgi:hypothetical protein